MNEQDEEAWKGFPMSSADCPYRICQLIIRQAIGKMMEALEAGPEPGSSNCNKTLAGHLVHFVVIKARDRQQGIFTGGGGHD